MKRILNSSSFLLSIGAVFASALNLYSFVILPSFVGAGNLEYFIRDNYLGGLYLFGIGSSIASSSIYIFNLGKNQALLQYATISLISFFLIGFGGIYLANIPESYICLVAALGMHTAGFFLAAMIRQGRALAASIVQIIQPMIFSGLLSLREFGFLSELNWTYLYAFSCLFFIIIVVAWTDWKWLSQYLIEPSSSNTSWFSTLGRIALSASFPLFFQLELILVGHHTSAILGDYAVLQKLYASVSISIFGFAGLRIAMINTDLQAGLGKLIKTKIFFLAICVSVCVFFLGYSIFFVGRLSILSIQLVVLSAFIAFLYTISSFLFLLMNSFKPQLTFKVFSLSLFVYMSTYYFVSPQKLIEFLMLAGVLFFSYIFFSYFTFVRVATH